MMAFLVGIAVYLLCGLALLMMIRPAGPYGPCNALQWPSPPTAMERLAVVLTWWLLAIVIFVTLRRDARRRHEPENIPEIWRG